MAAETVNKPASSRRAIEFMIEALPLLAVVPALLVASIFIRAAGVDPLAAMDSLLDGSLGNRNGLGVTAIRATPLLITGLGIAIGVRAGLWNLGGEGQIYIGALFATAFGLYVAPLGPVLLGMVGVFCAGAVGGAVWALVPALLRAFRGITEVISTLLLNFVAINIVTMMVQGPMEEAGTSFPASPTLPEDLFLPIVLQRTQMHAGLFVAFGLAALTFVLVQYSNFGLELRSVGHNPRAARFAGIPVKRRIIEAMLLSGALAGTAGTVEILGVHHRLTQGFSPGYGFDAIAVALLGAADARFIIPAAIFFGALRAGAPAMERSVGVPSEVIFLTQGTVIIAVAAAYGIRSVLRNRMVASR